VSPMTLLVIAALVELAVMIVAVIVSLFDD
jgi:hypothetical protein